VKNHQKILQMADFCLLKADASVARGLHKQKQLTCDELLPLCLSVTPPVSPYKLTVTPTNGFQELDLT
jgi:hypothetical protein